jgi:hypothetical protein
MGAKILDTVPYSAGSGRLFFALSDLAAPWDGEGKPVIDGILS